MGKESAMTTRKVELPFTQLHFNDALQYVRKLMNCSMPESLVPSILVLADWNSAPPPEQFDRLSMIVSDLCDRIPFNKKITIDRLKLQSESYQDVIWAATISQENWDQCHGLIDGELREAVGLNQQDESFQVRIAIGTNLETTYCDLIELGVGDFECALPREPQRIEPPVDSVQS